MIYPKLRPYLLEAQEKFLKYRLENILPLRSTYVIRFEEIKTGRRVTHLKFIIEENQQKVSQDPENVDFLKNKRAFGGISKKALCQPPHNRGAKQKCRS